MASIADLAWTNNFAAGRKPFQTDVETALNSIQTYVNASIQNNLEALTADAFPSGYAFDSDGVAQFTSGNNLFNKQKTATTYTGGDITIATTGAWTDVDASNAAISITPDYVAGDFVSLFQFTVSALSTNATNEINVRFRLTDGSENSDANPSIRSVTGVTATRVVQPVTIYHRFNSWSTALKTVKLQYFITTATATTLIVLANSTQVMAKAAWKA